MHKTNLVSRIFIGLFCLSQVAQGATVRKQKLVASTVPASSTPLSLPDSATPATTTTFKKPSSALSQFSGTWNLGLNSNNVESKVFTMNQVEMAVDATINYHLSSWMHLELRPHVSLQTAHSDNILDDSKPSNGWSLLKATTEIETRPIDVSAGAINMLENHSTLLAGDRAFPGARAYLYAFKSPAGELAAGGEAAVPSSASLSTKATSLEPTPTFSSAGVRARLGDKKDSYVYARAQTYKYQNLPIVIAQGSALFGNTVNKIDSNTSRFVYNYEGYEGRLQGAVNIAGFVYPELTGDYVKNTQAPESLSNAYAVKFGLRQDYKSWEFTPFVKGYRIEPDSAPIAYMDYSHTNAQGFRSGVQLEFRELFFKLTAFYDESHPIYYDPYINTEKQYIISVETLDATF